MLLVRLLLTDLTGLQHKTVSFPETLTRWAESTYSGRATYHIKARRLAATLVQLIELHRATLNYNSLTVTMRTFILLLLQYCLTSTVEASAIDRFNFRRTLPGGEHIGIDRHQGVELDVASKDLDTRSVSSTLGNLADRQNGDELVIAGITAVQEISISACPDPLTCFTIGAISVVLGYMAFQVTTNDNPSYQDGTFLPTRRSIDSTSSTSRVLNLLNDYLPTDDCALACQLSNKVDEGKWTHIANVTVNGTFHELHHFRNGSTAGMRARQKASKANSRRDPYDQDDYDLVVMDYYWNFGTVQAYDAFQSNPGIDVSAGAGVASYLIDNNYIAACLDFTDFTGLLDDGVFAVGWNDQPYIWNSQSQLDSQISTCDIDNILNEPGKFVPGPTETLGL